MPIYIDSLNKNVSAKLPHGRITVVIDNMSLGGAQRQVTMLAVGLKKQGYHVSVLMYWYGDFFADVLAKAGIPIIHVSARNRLHLIYAMRKAVRQSNPDVVIAWQPGASMLTELAGLPKRRFAVITTELNMDTDNGLRRRVRFALHRFADAVVSNSHAQRDIMIEAAPSLEKRTYIIINGVDLDHFQPAPKRSQPQQIRMLVLARFQPQKNPFGLLEALDIIRRESPSLDLVVDWYGNPIKAAEPFKWRYRSRLKWANYYRQLEEAIVQYSLQDRFRLHPGVKDVASLYHKADALCLPSFYEGTANVICEAMACGIPLLASHVGDTPRLVEEGRNGLLFDPTSPQDIADTILRFAALPPEARQALGQEGRRMAEATLSSDTFMTHFIDLIEQVRAGNG